MVSAVSTGGRRIDALKRLLAKERADTLARVKELMREQARNGGQPPADEMDVARSLSEVETHAALFDRAQERLSAIDAAIARLGAGVYGTCARCGDEIPLARLQVIPFAQYCVDCQNEANTEARSGQSGTAKPFGGRWTGPEELSNPDDSEEHVERVAHRRRRRPGGQRVRTRRGRAGSDGRRKASSRPSAEAEETGGAEEGAVGSSSLNVKPTVGFTLPWAGVTPAP